MRRWPLFIVMRRCAVAYDRYDEVVRTALEGCAIMIEEEDGTGMLDRHVWNGIAVVWPYGACSEALHGLLTAEALYRILRASGVAEAELRDPRAVGEHLDRLERLDRAWLIRILRRAAGLSGPDSRP